MKSNKNQIAGESKKAIVKGSLATAGGLITGKGLEHLNRVLVARFLTPELFGLYGLSVAVLNLAAVLSSLGLNTAVPRFVANYSAQGELGKGKGTFLFSLMILAPASLITAILLYMSSDFIAFGLYGKEKLSVMIRLVAPIVPLEVGLAVASGYLQGRKELFLSSIYWNTLPRLLFLASFLLFYFFFDITVTWVIAGLGVGYFFSLVLSLFQIFKSRLPRVQADMKQKAMLSYSWPLALSAVFSQLSSRCDLFVMAYYLTGAQMGHFNACHILANFILLPQAFVNRAVLPVMSHLAAKGEVTEIRDIYFYIINWYSILSIPLVVGFVVYSRHLVALFFGKPYDFDALPLVCGILAFGNLIGLLAGPNTMLMVSLGMTRLQMVIGVYSGFLGLTAAAVLIYHYGIIGAALANAFYIMVSNLSGLFFLRRWIPIVSMNFDFVKIMLSGAFAFAAVAVSSDLLPGGILLGKLLPSLLFAAMYLGLLLKMNILRMDDLMLLKRRWVS